MYYLSIIVLDNDINIPFFRVVPNTRWIYALSENISIIEEFANKIREYTDPSYLQYLNIEILDELSEEEYQDNNMDLFENEGGRLDVLYPEVVVNNSEYDYFYLDTFTAEEWSFIASSTNILSD